jgi:hypothetical protein
MSFNHNSSKNYRSAEALRLSPQRQREPGRSRNASFEEKTVEVLEVRVEQLGEKLGKAQQMCGMRLAAVEGLVKECEDKEKEVAKVNGQRYQSIMTEMGALPQMLALETKTLSEQYAIEH